VTRDCVLQSAPAPRFSRTPGVLEDVAAEADLDAVLARWRAR
jgi:hypothetical protein